MNEEELKQLVVSFKDRCNRFSDAESGNFWLEIKKIESNSRSNEVDHEYRNFLLILNSFLVEKDIQSAEEIRFCIKAPLIKEKWIEFLSYLEKIEVPISTEIARLFI